MRCKSPRIPELVLLVATAVVAGSCASQRDDVSGAPSIVVKNEGDSTILVTSSVVAGDSDGRNNSAAIHAFEVPPGGVFAVPVTRPRIQQVEILVEDRPPRRDSPVR